MCNLGFFLYFCKPGLIFPEGFYIPRFGVFLHIFENSFVSLVAEADISSQVVVDEGKHLSPVQGLEDGVLAILDELVKALESDDIGVEILARARIFLII